MTLIANKSKHARAMENRSIIENLRNWSRIVQQKTERETKRLRKELRKPRRAEQREHGHCRLIEIATEAITLGRGETRQKRLRLRGYDV